jgi:small subunit ribosomal protein S20
MPNIKSAIKRVKVIEKARLRNASQKSALRTALKAATALVNATKKLDKAVTKGLIHKNEASRRKSRLTKKVNALQA